MLSAVLLQENDSKRQSHKVSTFNIPLLWFINNADETRSSIPELIFLMNSFQVKDNFVQAHFLSPDCLYFTVTFT